MKEYLPLITLLVGIGIGYLLSRGKRKNEEPRLESRKQVNRLNDIIPMEEEKQE